MIIVDGGPPDRVDNEMTEYWREAYKSLKRYIMTSHFAFDPFLIFGEDEINTKVCSQPADSSTRRILNELRENGDRWRKEGLFNSYFGDGNPDYRISLLMGRAYVNKMSLIKNGGFLSEDEFEQCNDSLRNLMRGFSARKDKKVSIFMNQQVYKMIKEEIGFSDNINIIQKSFISPEEYTKLSVCSDISISRANRAVSNFQVAASGGGAYC